MSVGISFLEAIGVSDIDAREAWRFQGSLWKYFLDSLIYSH
jgi:hypothetical protein